MKRNNVLNNGILVSVSLNPTLEAEHFEPREQENKSRLLIISLYSLLIAIAVSFIAKLLVNLIDLFTNISFYWKFSFIHTEPGGSPFGIYMIFVPVIGGLIVGLMALYGSKAIRGHGIPEAMEQILTNESRIKPSITYLKPLSAAISIGTGGPFGAEGPIIATGGALGSTVGQLMKISHHERKVLLAAGATAGMSAIFGSPLAAIFLAIELLLFEFSSRSLIPVAIACVTGAAGHHLLFGSAPVFTMNDVAMVSGQALFFCIIIGIFIGLLSAFVTKAVYLIEDAFEKIPVPWMWWPAIGGLVAGVIGYFEPKTLGVGYGNISDVLSGNLALHAVLMLCIFKFISWAVALGSGTSGGTLAPLLTIGGSAGALFGMLFLHLFPQCGITIPLAALIGMSSMFAGSSRALLTSIVFALETTGRENTLLPLLGACLASYFVSFFFMKNTIMTEKIARRGIATPQSYRPDVLESINAGTVISGDEIMLSEENTIGEVREWLYGEKIDVPDHFLIVNGQGEFRGVLNSPELFNHFAQTNEPISSISRKSTVLLYDNEHLRNAAEKMARENLDALPVLSSENGKVIGILSYRDILSAFREDREHHDTRQRHLSLKRGRLKMLIRGKKIVTGITSIGKNERK